MVGKSELNENWYNKTHRSILPCAKILLKLVLIWKSYKQSKRVHLDEKSEIRIFLRKRLVRELGETDISEFFLQHLDHIVVSSVKISCNLVERLTRCKQKQFFWSTLYTYDIISVNMVTELLNYLLKSLECW